MTWTQLLERLAQIKEESPDLMEDDVVFLDGECFHHCDIAMGIENGIFFTVIKGEETE